jgi:hypothetical protein
MVVAAETTEMLSTILKLHKDNAFSNHCHVAHMSVTIKTTPYIETK